MSRVVPRTAQKSAGQLITGALWNAGPKALCDFITNPPLFRSLASSASATAAGTWYPASLTNTIIDTESGHSNVTNPSRYTAQVPGWYWVEGYFAWDVGGSQGRFECSIAKNGTIVPGAAQFSTRNNDLQSLSASTLVQLSAGNYVETWGRQNSGTTINTFIGSDLCPSMNVMWVHS